MQVYVTQAALSPLTAAVGQLECQHQLQQEPTVTRRITQEPRVGADTRPRDEGRGSCSRQGNCAKGVDGRWGQSRLTGAGRDWLGPGSPKADKAGGQSVGVQTAASRVPTEKREVAQREAWSTNPRDRARAVGLLVCCADTVSLPMGWPCPHVPPGPNPEAILRSNCPHYPHRVQGRQRPRNRSGRRSLKGQPSSCP